MTKKQGLTEQDVIKLEKLLKEQFQDLRSALRSMTQDFRSMAQDIRSETQKTRDLIAYNTERTNRSLDNLRVSTESDIRRIEAERNRDPFAIENRPYSTPKRPSKRHSYNPVNRLKTNNYG